MVSAVPSGRRIRVLHIVLNLHEGGLERVLGDLLRGIDAGRFEVHVLALEFMGRLAKGLEGYASLHVSEPLPRWSMLWPRDLARQIAAIDPDIVHTHSGVWYKGARAARMAEVPVAIHSDHGRRSPDPWIDRFVDGLASRYTTTVVAVSDELNRQLRDTVVHRPSSVRTLLNGVDTARFRPRADSGALREELALDEGAPILGSIGRLYPIKRYDLMLEAFNRLVEGWSDGSEPVLLIAGDGPERPTLERMVTDLGLEGRARLLGWREDVENLHSAFDIFTMSSRSEGTSIGLLEAMSAGICPVVTRVGGNPVVLGDGLRHRLCEPESAEALSHAWREALANEETRLADATAARSRVVAAFGIDRMVREYEEMYASAVQSFLKPTSQAGSEGVPDA